MTTTTLRPTPDPARSGQHGPARTSLDAMLTDLIAVNGSDLHITAGAAPTMRRNGDMHPMAGYEPLTSDDTESLLRAVTGESRWAQFEIAHELDFTYSIPGISRFRVNLFKQRGSYGAAFRAVPHIIKQLNELGLPDAVARFAALPRGLVLVTGPTGSGKTTTLAALLDLANRTRSAHIVTIEEPIEFLHKHIRCLVNQREVGTDTSSFATALKYALRQDPDIILIGELRDLETTSTALTAAETGHLVLATLHTSSAAQTIDRIIDIYPPHQQHQIRAQLSTSLQGVVTQALAPRADGSGRSVVTEIMVVTPAIRNLIREGKTHQILSSLQTGANLGMLSFDQHLASKVRSGEVSMEQALDLCHSREEFLRSARH